MGIDEQSAYHIGPIQNCQGIQETVPQVHDESQQPAHNHEYCHLTHHCCSAKPHSLQSRVVFRAHRTCLTCVPPALDTLFVKHVFAMREATAFIDRLQTDGAIVLGVVAVLHQGLLPVDDCKCGPQNRQNVRQQDVRAEPPRQHPLTTRWTNDNHALIPANIYL